MVKTLVFVCIIILSVGLSASSRDGWNPSCGPSLSFLDASTCRGHGADGVTSAHFGSLRVTSGHFGSLRVTLRAILVGHVRSKLTSENLSE